MKVLVTGGLGFIGSHVVRALLDQGAEINILDDHSNSQPDLDFLDNANISCSLPGETITDLKTALHWANGCDAIIHLAAKIDVQESLKNPEKYTETNIRGTYNLLEAAHKQNIPLVFASSAAVYGDCDHLPVKEAEPTKPLSIYGGTKVSGEALVESYAYGYGLPCSNLRLFNVYGPGQSKEYAGVVTKFLESAKNNEPITIFGDGTQTRDFVYVQDVVQAILLSLNKKPLGTYNIAYGKPTSINDLAETVKKLFNPDIEINHKDPLPGDIKHSCADISKSKIELGYNPQFDLEKGLKETWKYYQK